MSTVSVTNIKHGSSASNNLVLDANGNVTAAGTVAMASPFAMRNKIINGAMEIDQRNAGASVTPTDGAYTLDRWKFRVSQTSKLTVQKNAGSVTPAAGLPNYLGVTSSSAYSVNSTDYFVFTQEIEGFNFADLNFGTANAKTVTLSFWVRSSLTGTFSVTLRNNAANRSYPVTYTISSSNTWEQKTITIPGDTSGTWVGATNGIGASVIFNLGCGSTFNGTSGSWQGGNYTSVSGATSVVGTNGATFYLTGVQLEVGSVATPFERRLYNQELAMCYRYFYKKDPGYYGVIVSGSDTYRHFNESFPVTMRATPTIINVSFSGSTASPSGSQFTTVYGTDIYSNSTSTIALVNLTSYSANAEL